MAKKLSEILEENHKNKGKWKWLKWLLIAGGVIIVAGIAIIFFYKNPASAYVYTKVKRQNLREIVDITGNVKAGVTVKLGFQQSGQVEKINFNTGDIVKKGDIIAILSNKDQQFAVNKARADLMAVNANLHQKLAGSTDQDIAIAQANLDQTIAAESKVQVNLDNTKNNLKLIRQKQVEDLKQQQLVVDEAKNKYDYAQKNQGNTVNTSNQTLINAKKDLQATLLNVSSQLQQALIDYKSIAINNGTSLLGSDFNRLDQAKINPSNQLYNNTILAFNPFYTNLKTQLVFTSDQLISSTQTVEQYISNMLRAITLATDALTILSSSSTITSTQITALKSTLLNDGNVISGGVRVLSSNLQILLNAKLNITSSSDTSNSSTDSAKNYYEQQQQILDSLKIQQQLDLNTKQTNIDQLQSELKINQASVSSAEANLNQIKAPPRAVDVANLRALVAAARVNLQLAQQNFDKTLLKAPINGILTRKNIEAGEQYTFQANQDFVPIFEMISDQKLKIDANIAEANIEKVKVGDKAQIKLDAIPGKIFNGIITSIDPVETKIQDVVFYKATVIITDKDERIKPGMTADVIIVLHTANNVLTIPERALVQKNGKSYIRIFKNDQIKNVEVTTGISNLNGDIEIKNGLIEGQQIIVNSLNA